MKIAIIGAGAAGLAAAHTLTKAGHTPVIYEAGAEVGGLAAGFKEADWRWSLEKFYHHWFYTDQDVLNLIKEIGHADKIRFYSPTTSVWDENGTYPLDAPVVKSATVSRVLNVLNLPGLSLFSRLRFGLVGALLKLYPFGRTLEKQTADRWLRRWVGEDAYNLTWRPLLIGKFGELYDQVNMAWMWARMYKRTAQLGTYEGGFQAMLEDLADAVKEQGGTLYLNTPVERIASLPGGGFEVTLSGGQTESFDRVISTTSPRWMARLAPELPDAYVEQLENLRSMGALVLILALDRQLMEDGTYWLNLPATTPDKDKNPFPFLALVEHTNYVSKEHFNREHIVYLGDYLPVEHEHYAMSEEELAEKFLPSLTKVNPDFKPEWIRKQWVFKAPYAQPVPLVNHSASIPDIRTPVKGLYFASMSQVYPWDRGTNYAVEIGQRTALMAMQDAEAS